MSRLEEIATLCQHVLTVHPASMSDSDRHLLFYNDVLIAICVIHWIPRRQYGAQSHTEDVHCPLPLNPFK